MNSIEEILDVAGALHAAALTPNNWPPALEGMIRLLRADHAILVGNDLENQGEPLLACAGIEHAQMMRSFAALERCDPATVPRLPMGSAVVRSELVADRDYLRSQHYNEVTRPLNGFHGLMAQHATPSTHFVVVTCRRRHADDFERRERALLQMLLPHFATAIELGHRVRAAEQRAAGLTSALDRIDTGVILCDASGRPCYVNACAAGIAAEADGLSIESIGLASSSPAATRRLRETVIAVGADSAMHSRRLRLARPSHRPPLLLTLSPVGRSAQSVAGTDVPRVAIFIREPDAAIGIDPLVLTDAFRLTPRESDVAVLIAHGHTVEAIADRLKIGVGTARNHLKRVFEKTGIRTQPALVAMLRGFVHPAD